MYNQPQNQVQNKPTVAYVLSLVGGILGLLASLAFIGYGAWLSTQLSSISYYYSYYDTSLFGWSWTILIGLGGLLGIIGGILALIYKPVIAGAPQQSPPQQNWGQQPITRICPQCGRVVKEDVRFCPNCGKQLN